MFYCRCFFFRHAFSAVPRPIAEKLCHMIGNWLNFIIKNGGAHKNGGQSMQNFGRCVCLVHRRKLVKIIGGTQALCETVRAGRGVS